MSNTSVGRNTRRRHADTRIRDDGSNKSEDTSLIVVIVTFIIVVCLLLLVVIEWNKFLQHLENTKDL